MAQLPSFTAEGHPAAVMLYSILYTVFTVTNVGYQDGHS